MKRFGWSLAVTLLLVGCREIAAPVVRHEIVSICRATLTETGMGPLTCERDACAVTLFPDGSREYVCETHHFILEPGGEVRWL